MSNPNPVATTYVPSLVEIMADSRAALSAGATSMRKLVLAETGENASTVEKRQARAEIKVRLADKLAPDTLTVTLHRDGRGGYEVVEPIMTEHGERLITGSLRLTDRKTLSASALANVTRLLNTARAAIQGTVTVK